EKAAFEAAYTAAGGDAGGIYTGETYDAVMIIAKAAMADSDGDLRDDLATVGTNYAGASGVHTFDANGDVDGSGYLVCKFHAADNLDCGKSWTRGGGMAGSWTEPVMGCTDSTANNYNAEAMMDDGSCTFDPTGGGEDDTGGIPGFGLLAAIAAAGAVVLLGRKRH
ncbi:MAG: hypothetical protein QF519_06075, partial [Candidatus Poseidoniia archaeon]|nr:hypothetical protein [Candidatus Poseidoniia archaeon]